LCPERCDLFYLHDEPHRLRFALVGRLEEEELRQLESAWRTAESIRAHRPLVVDVSRLQCEDEPTQALLDRLRAAGATVLGEHNQSRRSGSLTAESRWRRALAVLAWK
jgi:hypothetical protein